MNTLIKQTEIRLAALYDFNMQTKYNNVYDRQKGFIEGVKWAMCRLKINVSKDEILQAAKNDFDKQTSYNDSYDRQKGFIEGVKWIINKKI